MSPRKVRISTSPNLPASPTRSVIHLWSQPNLKVIPGSFRYCLLQHPNVASIGSHRVVLQPPQGKVPCKLRLPMPGEAHTNVLTIVALRAPDGVPPSRVTTMETFLRTFIRHCGKCVICTRPVDFSTVGIPHAIDKELLELETATVWGDELIPGSDRSQ